MPFLKTSPGVNIYYEEAGKGRPLVMIHGWAGSGMLWNFQRELADSFRLVIPDLRGHGRSSSPAERFTLDDLVSDIDTLIETLELTDANLLGWSLGSLVALASYPRLRKRLAGLVLVGATARFTATDGYPHGQEATEPRGMRLRLKRDYSGTMGEFFRSMFAQGELTPEQEGRIAREILSGGRLTAPTAANAALSILAAADLREKLPEIDLPVLIIHGNADVICPIGAARYMAERLPDTRLVEFAGVGHAPHISQPEEFNSCVRRFLLEGLHGPN